MKYIRLLFQLSTWLKLRKITGLIDRERFCSFPLGITSTNQPTGKVLRGSVKTHLPQNQYLWPNSFWKKYRNFKVWGRECIRCIGDQNKILNKRETCLLIDKLPLGDPLKSTGSRPLSISSSEKWEDSINRFQASTTATHTEKYISY